MASLRHASTAQISSTLNKTIQQSRRQCTKPRQQTAVVVSWFLFIRHWTFFQRPRSFQRRKFSRFQRPKFSQGRKFFQRQRSLIHLHVYTHAVTKRACHSDDDRHRVLGLFVTCPSCSPTWILSARFAKHRRQGLRHG